MATKTALLKLSDIIPKLQSNDPNIDCGKPEEYYELLENVINDETTIAFFKFSERDTKILIERYKKGSDETLETIAERHKITTWQVSTICKKLTIQAIKDYARFVRSGTTELANAAKETQNSEGNQLKIFNLDQKQINALANKGITGITHFENYKTTDFLGKTRIGQNTFRKIQIILHYLGYKFKDETKDDVKKDIIPEIVDKETTEKLYKEKQRKIKQLESRIEKLKKEQKELNREIAIYETLIEVKYNPKNEKSQSNELYTLGLDTRRIIVLQKSGISNVKKLISKPYKEISLIKGIGKENARKMQIILHYMGQKFTNETDEDIKKDMVPGAEDIKTARREYKKRKNKLKKNTEQIQKLKEEQKELNRIIEICNAIINSNIDQELKRER